MKATLWDQEPDEQLQTEQRLAMFGCCLTEGVPPYKAMTKILNSIPVMSQFRLRQAYIHEYGFSIPSREVIQAVKKLNRPVVSVGCGTAYLDKLLENAGISVVSTDPRPPSRGHNHYRFTQEFRKIRQYKGTTAVTKFPEHTVYMSWPSYQGKWAYDTALAMAEGTYLVYIGEGDGGATATDSFFGLLYSHFEEIKYIPIPQFRGLHDYCYIYRKTGWVNATE